MKKLIYKAKMDCAKLQNYLYENIPQSLSLGITVLQASADSVVLYAPLCLNINHKKTVFGGSLHSVATLACWSLLFVRQHNYPQPIEIVIAKSDIRYLRAVTTDFSALASIDEGQDWARCETMLERRGKTRIKMHAVIYQESVLAVEYMAEFVILKTDIKK